MADLLTADAPRTSHRKHERNQHWRHVDVVPGVSNTPDGSERWIKARTFPFDATGNVT
jgi:hypothetical protein